jgi:anti-sigma factor RsiW
MDFLLAYVEGELEPAARAAFDRHLQRCSSCVAYLDSYRETVALARGAWQETTLSPGRLPVDLEQAVLFALRDRPSG